MRTARALIALPSVLLVAACGGQPSAGGFASHAGQLGCADVVAWGTVQGSDAGDEGLEVTFAVAEWVHPGEGPDSITFVTDDPAREVGAPAWPTAQDTILVIGSGLASTERLDVTEGERAVQQWRDAGAPRFSDEQCGRA